LELTEFNRIQTYIKLDQENQDEIIFIELIKKQELENKYIVMLTNEGYITKVKLTEIPIYSKSAKGVLLTQLKTNDYITYSKVIDISLVDKNYFILLDKNNNLIEIDLNVINFIKRGKPLTKKEKLIQKEIKSNAIINNKLAIIYNLDSKIDFIYDYKEITKLKEVIDTNKNINFIEINKSILKKIYQ
jgi:DNA gyrase/topoisomerase IV subunit A